MDEYQVTDSLSWQKIRASIEQQLRKVPYNADAHRMLRNIDAIVKTLALKEIEVRAGRAQPHSLNEIRNGINDSITLMTENILVELLFR